MKKSKMNFGKIYRQMEKADRRMAYPPYVTPDTTYVFMPHDYTLDDEEKQSLRVLTATNLLFVDWQSIHESLANSKEINAEYDTVLSLSGAGEYVYERLVDIAPSLGSYQHINVEISRNKFGDSFKKLRVGGNRVLVIDDTFNSGLTLSRMIGRIGEEKEITAVVEDGPEGIVDEFRKYYPRVKILCGIEFDGDFRDGSLAVCNFDAWIHYALDNYESPLKAIFTCDTDEAVEMIKSIAGFDEKYHSDCEEELLSEGDVRGILETYGTEIKEG